MSSYAMCDPRVSFEVHDSIIRQRWYLTQELSVLSLFDSGIEITERREIAQALLSFPRPQSFLPGQPIFPHISSESKIRDFIGSRSWLIFNLLDKANSEWLTLSPEEWEENEEYVSMWEVVSSMSVTNDTAERGVKKVVEYANSANDGGQRGTIINVAAWHHTQMSGYTKEDLENCL